MNYQWYPGHMTKSVRAMQDQLKLIDLVIEILDARIPFSSRNPDIDRLGNGKFRLVILNKADLADPAVTALWKAYFEGKGIKAVECNAKAPGLAKSLKPVIAEVCKDKIERDKKRGILNRPIRAMICGIPNVGKSTFINTFIGKAAAKTGNKPGVTRSNQWIRTGANVELLDTPGILWPRFEDQTVGMHLAFIGSMNDQILITEELASDLIRFLRKDAPGKLEAYYHIAGAPEGAEHLEDSVLRQIAASRGFLKKGEEPDTEKASAQTLEDFRAGRFGRISVERPE
ncbi:MAG: ribosome biogenesis GTPase YlqF [Lachnospiraceae bacterium]|nr:ribosome biogenesis GTPase YlqF [Lachnospiraceae bacterium]